MTLRTGCAITVLLVALIAGYVVAGEFLNWMFMAFAFLGCIIAAAIAWGTSITTGRQIKEAVDKQRNL